MVEIQEEISKKPEDFSKLSANKKSLSCILDCQTLIRRGKLCIHAEIPGDLQQKLPPDMTQIIDRSKSHYENWVASKHFSNKTNQSFQSFSAINSFFQDTSTTKTKIAFTPILTNVATEYVTIHTII